MRKMGLGEMGDLSQIVPFSFIFPPISDQPHAFFLQSLHFPPLCHHFLIFPFSHAPAGGWLIRLRLADACA